MDLERLKSYVLHELETKLASDLSYHGVHHTLYVYNAAITIAKHENVIGNEFKVLMAAVLLHDFGFVETYANHEEKGCELARNILPDFGYNLDQINHVCHMIMRTKIPQVADNLLEEIICDADLDYLGTDEFLPIGNTLFAEFMTYGIVKDEEGWNRLQLQFLQTHRYFTSYALKFREEKKQSNLKIIADIVRHYDQNK